MGIVPLDMRYDAFFEGKTNRSLRRVVAVLLFSVFIFSGPVFSAASNPRQGPKTEWVYERYRISNQTGSQKSFAGYSRVSFQVSTAQEFEWRLMCHNRLSGIRLNTILKSIEVRSFFLFLPDKLISKNDDTDVVVSPLG